MSANTYAQIPVRLEAALVSNPPVNPVDANTGLEIAFWRSQGLVMQVGIFDQNLLAVNLSNLTTLQIILMTSPSAVVATLQKTVLAAAIIPTITRAGWLNGTEQQATFTFTNAELDLSLAAQQSQEYWLVLQGTTTAGTVLAYAAGWVKVYNPGNTLPPPSVGLVSAHQQASTAGDISVLPTSQIHLEEITATGSPETRRVIVAATGLITGARVSLRFKLPATDNIIFQVYDQATTGALLFTIQSQADGYLPTSLLNFWFDGTNLQRESQIQPANGQQT